MSELMSITPTQFEVDQSSGSQPTHSAMPDALLSSSVWSDQQLSQEGIDIIDTPIVTIGGGLGSLALVQCLNIARVPRTHYKVLAPTTGPTESFRFLAGNSQIRDADRLRSDSGSTMDNPWGFPSYAWREAARERTIGPLWRSLTEPILSEFFTPRAGHVFDSVERETERLGWNQLIMPGWARLVRRRTGGGYFVLLSRDGQSRYTKAIRCRYAHISLGYPGMKLLADLQEFRLTHSQHAHLVVGSYEPHEHLYTAAMMRPTTVLVRGSGIAASRVIERVLNIAEEKDHEVRIVHLFRTYVDQSQGKSPWFRRPGGDGWAYQPFNFPKSAWGGEMRDRMAGLHGADRAALLSGLGGTTTAPRRDWRRQLKRHGQAGTYRQLTGTVAALRPGHSGSQVRTVVATEGGPIEVDADYIVDATGMDANIEGHSVFADLLAHGGARRNPTGRLEVSDDFEITGTANEPGRLYATGGPTLGGHYAGVDSFLGLQYAALRVADDLASHGAIPPITARSSAAGWWRWARHRSEVDTEMRPTP
ncbi:MAG: hypothetical protein GY745_14860 [Actinomycetia bacterium]|nr:hypothetical protein [Actinomycetes bacterium]